MPRIQNEIAVTPNVEVIAGKLEKNFPDLVSPSEVREILNHAGASVVSVTERLVDLFHTSDHDKTVHEIGKTFLAMHGVLNEDSKQGVAINLVIQSDDAKVMNILNPQRG